MELIPILSAIILVATISTFLLAIGAYILYKVRESKGQQEEATVPSTVVAELLTPEEPSIQVPHPGPVIAPQPALSYQRKSEAVNYHQPIENQFIKYTSEGNASPFKEEKSTGALKWK